MIQVTVTVTLGSNAYNEEVVDALRSTADLFEDGGIIGDSIGESEHPTDQNYKQNVHWSIDPLCHVCDKNPPAPKEDECASCIAQRELDGPSDRDLRTAGKII